MSQLPTPTTPSALTDPLLLNADLQWRHLRALRTLRTGEGTAARIQDHPYVRHLMRNGYLATKLNNPKKLEPQPSYAAHYDRELHAVVEEVAQFLDQYDLTEQYTLTLRDVLHLQNVLAHRFVILDKQLSRRKIGARYADSSKQFDRDAMDTAVRRVLNIERFPQLDRIIDGAVYVTGAPRARCIVLCENKDYLLQPDVAERLRVSLWHAGGADTTKLQHSPDPHLELYYACDWDHDGLNIFRRVHAIYTARGFRITLLTPPSAAPRKPETSEFHNSRWDAAKWREWLVSDVSSSFTAPQRALIQDLISTREWIEEEGVDLSDLLAFNGVV